MRLENDQVERRAFLVMGYGGARATHLDRHVRLAQAAIFRRHLDGIRNARRFAERLDGDARQGRARSLGDDWATPGPLRTAMSAGRTPQARTPHLIGHGCAYRHCAILTFSSSDFWRRWTRPSRTVPRSHRGARRSGRFPCAGRGGRRIGDHHREVALVGAAEVRIVAVVALVSEVGR